MRAFSKCLYSRKLSLSLALRLRFRCPLNHIYCALLTVPFFIVCKRQHVRVCFVRRHHRPLPLWRCYFFGWLLNAPTHKQRHTHKHMCNTLRMYRTYYICIVYAAGCRGLYRPSVFLGGRQPKLTRASKECVECLRCLVILASRKSARRDPQNFFRRCWCVWCCWQKWVCS